MIIILTTLAALWTLTKTKPFFQRTEFVMRHNRLKEEAQRYEEAALISPYALFHLDPQLRRFRSPKKEHLYNEKFKKEIGRHFWDIIAVKKKPSCFLPPPGISYFPFMFALLKKEMGLYLAGPLLLGIVLLLLPNDVQFLFSILALTLAVRGGILLGLLFVHHPFRIKRKLARIPDLNSLTKRSLHNGYSKKLPSLKKTN
ncbi:hypothetical protein [Planococcus sp. CAU13]|uniref:hypothetical protein n=1 Tax=Planococcus sp. CAU13 TaxID=1541197 RepID=UPI00052FF61A|nr:hypothetical protein [Planococcus sp. CAU13]